MELRLSRIPAQEQPWQSDIVGKDMAGLEKKLCQYVGVPHCVGVESATTGLLLALKAMDIGPGDSVLCTSFSYFATAEVIALTGAEPILVDINPNTYNIDPYCLEYVVGKCVRTGQPVPRALIAVDLFGLPCNYEGLEEICQRHGIQLIEDMAQSFGATFHERMAGSFGRMAVASFFPAKPLDELGEGGAIFCSDERDLRRLQSLRRKVHLEKQQQTLYNTGSGLDAVQATVVADKLEKFTSELATRRKVAAQYRKRFSGAVKMQQVAPGYESAYTQFVVALDGPEARARLVDFLHERHIPASIFEPSPLRRREEVQEWGKVALVNARTAAQKILSLPVHPYLSGRVVDFICDSVLEFCDLERRPIAVGD